MTPIMGRGEPSIVESTTSDDLICRLRATARVEATWGLIKETPDPVSKKAVRCKEAIRN